MEQEIFSFDLINHSKISLKIDFKDADLIILENKYFKNQVTDALNFITNDKAATNKTDSIEAYPVLDWHI